MSSFNRESGKRIARVVKHIEGQPPKSRARRSRLRRPPGDTLLGVLDEDLFPGSSAQMSIWGGDVTKGEFADTGDNLDEVWDYFLDPGETVTAGARVEVAWMYGAWWVVASRC